MEIQWQEIGEFVKSVGIPLGLLLLIVVPLVYAVYQVIKAWFPEVFKKHIGLIDTLQTGLQKLITTVEDMQTSNEESKVNHEKTHNGIKMGIQVAYEACEAARKAIGHMNDQELQRKVMPHIDAIERLISTR